MRDRIKAALAVSAFIGVLVGAVIVRDLAFRDLPATVDWAYRSTHGQSR